MAETARKGKKMPKSKEQHLAELPKKKFKIMNLVWVVIMVLGLFLSVNVTNTHIIVLFNNFSQFTDIFVQMCHPDWGYAATAVPLLIETIKMAILGTVIGSAIAFVYSLLIARNIVKNKAVTGILRVMMKIVRTIQDLLLSAIFVAIVCIWPVGGVLALAVLPFGVVVKLLYESIGSIVPGRIDALTAVGEKKLQIIHFALMPLIMTYFISNVLYAFEITVRE